MYKKQRKTSKALVVLSVMAFIFLALFAAAFVVFVFLAAKSGDSEIENFQAIFNYHKDNTLDLVFLKLSGEPSIIYLIANYAVYGLAGLWVLFLIIGIIVGAKKRRGIVALGIIVDLLGVAAALIVATGLAKYLKIINNEADMFVDYKNLLIPTIALLATGGLFLLFAIILYFACLAEAAKNPKVLVKEKAAEEQPQEENDQILEEPAENEAVVDEPLKEPAQENEEPVMFESFVAEPQEEAVYEEPMEEEPVAEEEPQPEEQKEEEKAEEPVEEDKPQQVKEEPRDESFSKNDLVELIRSIVRDEILHSNQNPPQNNNNSAPIAANGPFVIQYFGTMPGMPQPQPYPPYPYPCPQPQPQQPVEEPKREEPAPKPAPAPVEEEKKPEPVKKEPAPAPQPEPAPVIEKVEPVKAEPEPVPEEKKPIIRISFQERMLTADEEMRKNYSELKNEILSYGVNSRVSNSGDAFRLHRKTYVKITIAGLSLKLYFALNPDDYKDSPIPVQNAGHKGIYAEIPLVFKVKSGLSMRRAKELIQAVMEKDGLEQGPVGETDWASELSKEAEDSDED